MLDPARTVKLTQGALLDPEPTWRAYLPEAGDWTRTAALLTGPLIVAAALIAFVLGIVTGGTFGMRPTLMFTLLGVVNSIAGIVVVAFIVSALSSAFGGKGGFALGLAAATLAFVPGYVGQAVSPLPWIGWLLGLGLAIYSLVLLWRIIPIYLAVPPERRVVHYVLTLVASFVAMLVVSAVIGGGLIGAGMTPGMGGPDAGMPGAQSGPLAGIARQGELMAMAEQDSYTPPADGRVTEAQVEELIRVMRRTNEVVAERAARVEELAGRADSAEEMSLSDLGAMIGNMSQVGAINTAEIEVVKTAGGNWAEHQWVKQALRTAWLQQDTNDAVAANYALYREYEHALGPFIAQ